MATNVDLWVPFDNEDQQHALSIPVDACQNFSSHPLAWLRYLGYTIYGEEGYISTSPGGQEVADYHAPVVPGDYHYVSQGHRLLDPKAMDDRTSIASSSNSTGRHGFADIVRDRDGTCVMTGASTVQACHIIPHAKGDQYMVNLVNHRDPAVDPPFDSINDIRNGILLSNALHPSFGASKAAFLRTPNFAMTVNDVALVLQPNADVIGTGIHPSVAISRLTFHHFDVEDIVISLIAPHNSDARPSSSDDWPPGFLFDVAYGCAALSTWGLKEFVEFATENTKDIYYDLGDGDEAKPDDIDEDDDDDDDGEDDDDGGGGDDDRNRGGGRAGIQRKGTIRAAEAERQRAERRERVERRAQRWGKAQDGQAVDAADVVMRLWVHNARKAMRKASVMREEKAREKVQEWLHST